MLTRAAIYVRVSDPTQAESFSLETQERGCKDYAASRGWVVVGVYTEPGHTATTASRPVFQEVVTDAKRGLFDALIVYKLDRYSRNALASFQYLEELRRASVILCSVLEPFDFSNPTGRLVFGISSVFGEHFSAQLGERVSHGKRQRAARGYWNGQIPYGYTTPNMLRTELRALYLAGGAEELKQAAILVHALEEAGGVLDTAAIPHPTESAAVILAYTQYRTGHYSYAEIADLLNRKGYRARRGGLFSVTSIRKMLSLEFYTGKISREGKYVPGNHPALIDQEVFAQCRRVRQQRRTAANTSPLRRVAVFPLTGLLHCADCGSKMSGRARQTKKHGLRRGYRDDARRTRIPCAAGGAYIDADSAEAQVNEFLASLVLPEDWQDRLRARLSRPQPQAQEGEYQRIERRLASLKNLYAWGDISQEEYLAQKNSLTNILLEKKDNAKIETVVRFGEQLPSLLEIIAQATPAERKALYSHLITGLYVRSKVIAVVEATPLLWLLLAHTGGEPNTHDHCQRPDQVLRPD